MQSLLNECNINIEELKKSIVLQSLIYNKAIEAFKELVVEWGNVYKSLKEHKSNEEWIKKFFILDYPNY